MKKWLKRLPLLGVATLLAGGLLFLVGFAITGFDVHALSNIQVQQKTYTESAENTITNLSLDFDTTDIQLVFDNSLTGMEVEYPQKQTIRGKNINTVTFTETENSLTVTEKEEFHLSIFTFASPTLTLRLPTSRAYALSIKTSTGDIVIPQGNFTSLSIETSTGDVSLNNVQANGVKIKVSTGDISLNNVTVASALLVETTTGDVKTAQKVTAETLSIKTDTGDIKARNSVINATTITLFTGTGDITATLTGTHMDYKISASTNTGDSNIDTNLGYTENASRTLLLKTSTGDIRIYFA